MPEMVTGSRLPSIEAAVIWGVATLVAIFAVAVFIIGYDALVSNLGRLNGTAIGICLLLMVWQLGCRFLRWFWYARSLNLKIGPAEAALFYGAGLGMTMTPGRLGELVRLWFLEKRFSVPYRRIAGLYLVDRVSDAAAYFILFSIGSTAYERGSSIAWGGMVITGVLIVLMMYPTPVLLLLNAGYAIVGRGRKLVLWLRRAVRNSSRLFQPRVFLPGLTIGAIGWFGPPGVLAMALGQMGIDFPLLHATAIYAAAALVGGVTMMPGGGGGTEAVLVGLLVSSSVPLDAAISATIVTRVTFLWIPVGIGMALLPVAMKRVRAS